MVTENQDGFLAALLGQGLSEWEIRSFLPVGGHRMQRIRNEMKDPSLREKRNQPRPRYHAATDIDIQNIV